MMSNKKTQTDCAESVRVNKSDIAISNNSVHSNHNTTDSYITRFLLYGEKNAVPADMLCACAGFKTTRELRHAVETARENGAVILTSTRGYFLPERDEAGTLTDKGYMSALEWRRMRKHSALSILKSIKSAEREIRQYELREQFSFKEVR